MIDIYDFVNLAESYARLGTAVSDQLTEVLDGEIEETNPNALKLMIPFLKRLEKYGIEGAEDELERIENYLNELWG